MAMMATAIMLLAKALTAMANMACVTFPVLRPAVVDGRPDGRGPIRSLGLCSLFVPLLSIPVPSSLVLPWPIR